MPIPNSSTKNYFKGKKGVQKCRARFSSEIKAGRMIGGRGVNERCRERFLGERFLQNSVWGGPKKSRSLGENNP